MAQFCMTICTYIDILSYSTLTAKCCYGRNELDQAVQHSFGSTRNCLPPLIRLRASIDSVHGKALI